MTIREIAEKAGVSTGTVDRVINHRGRVSQATKAKIDAITEGARFTPNPLARRLRRGRAYRLCALIPERDQDSLYWEQALQGILSAADSLRPLGVETVVTEFDRYDSASFADAAMRVLESRPDGVVFAPIMPEKTRTFLDGLDAAAIPYVFFDADPPPGAAPLSVIGHDSFKGGYLAGRLLHLFAGAETLPFAVLDAHGEDYHITARRDGFLQYANEQRFKVVALEYSGLKGMELPREQVVQFLEDCLPVSGIFVTNSMAHRVAEVVQQTFETRSFHLVGYDLVPANRRFLESGRMDAVISQHPDRQGYAAIQCLYRHVVLDEEVPPKITIPLDIYLTENIPPP